MAVRAPVAALVAAVVMAVFVPSALAATKTESASAGGVRATLTYTTSKYLPIARRLTITRSGAPAYSEPVSAPQCSKICNVLSLKNDVHVVSLDPSTAPQVVLDLYTGGAHCCQVEQVFTYSGSAYTLSQYDFGNPGERLVTLGGSLLFETADNRFAYEFTDYAASGMPLEFIQFTGGKFLDVTRNFPTLIAKDAEQDWKAFEAQATSKWTDTTGVVAAWAADEDELGKSSYVAGVLAKQAAAGHLNSPIESGGEKFVAALQKFLKRTGYLS